MPGLSQRPNSSAATAEGLQTAVSHRAQSAAARQEVKYAGQAEQLKARLGQ